ncbi:thiopeptide-type bacteriocin biosynthesis protein [Aquimarina sediminis]|uniref:thiopeptide-type bacteriocin biosynthesis protein n=1 Tax=Aquimarina sediminis TaxID=2070536 RepID=UPI000CA05214|nr:thiopeptide-type bacteriocin biosynthesis protein [Aquimarina sediminis]
MRVKRTFIVGDEWLYYKLYCGARTSDMLLVETIKPLVEQLLEEKLIDSWFFIRYGDPDFHLRIRFHLLDLRKIGDIILRINNVLQQYITQRVVYKVQTDTYIRELERYGVSTIEASEKLFFYDSAMLLDAISVIEDEELYFLFVVKGVDKLLESFNYTLQEKLNIVNRNTLAFKNEFHADKRLNKQLDKKYRGLKSKLHSFLESSYSAEDYAILDNILAHRKKKSLSIVKSIIDEQQFNRLEVELDDLLSSYIHMTVNRAFRSKQRFYELVCYDFLLRYYKTKISYSKADKEINKV